MSCSVLCSTGRVYRNDKLLLSWLAIPFPLSPPTPPFSPSSTTTMYSNFGSSDISKNLRTRIKKPKKNRKPRPKIQRGSKQAGGEIQRRGQCRGLIDEIGVSDETATTPGGERPWRGGAEGRGGGRRIGLGESAMAKARARAMLSSACHDLHASARPSPHMSPMRLVPRLLLLLRIRCKKPREGRQGGVSGSVKRWVGRGAGKG
ncbi:hypothetical protein BHM03_00006997 [Ensete ventricosum]|nr:hypothetical protein BHM03_00006997 [Ensete ventricosum]